MGQDSESIELKSEEELDLRLGAAASVSAAGSRSPAASDAVGIEIAQEGDPGLELSLSPVRPAASSEAGEHTSVFDQGDDLVEKTAVISRGRPALPTALPSADADRPVLPGAASSGLDDGPYNLGEDAGIDIIQESLAANDPSRTERPERAVDGGGPLLSADGLVTDAGGSVSMQDREPPPVTSAAGESGQTPLPPGLEDPGFNSGTVDSREIDSLWRSLISEFQLDESQSGGLIWSSREGAVDRVDLGISLLEMGLHDSALREFRQERMLSPIDSIAIVPLEAQALLGLNRAFEAVSLLESHLGASDSDGELPAELRFELLYWMARSCEALERDADALIWLKLLQESAPQYRDVEQRLRSLGGALK
jgi:hypothetical protein